MYNHHIAYVQYGIIFGEGDIDEDGIQHNQIFCNTKNILSRYAYFDKKNMLIFID